MIRSVRIQGYRGLEHFEMSDLGRINLLVGKNNSGKSSVLEALYLLASEGNPRALSRILRERGELTESGGSNDERRHQELDICHLFFGHKIDINQSVTIKAEGEDNLRPELKLRIMEQEHKINNDVDSPIINESQYYTLCINNKRKYPLQITFYITFGNNIISSLWSWPISPRGGIDMRAIDTLGPMRGRPDGSPDSSPSVQFVPHDSLTPTEIVNLWDKISLTPSQGDVLQAIQKVDKTIENIAAYSGNQLGAFRFFDTARGGFKVKLKDQTDPMPIGSLGDGVWRMLAHAISLAQAKGGILLIDEIDTGLHYSVQEDLWRMIAETARELDVQVFATTHSYDCITSLASICRADPATHSEVTIQRIEAGRKHAVAYDEGDIVMAAERHIEMR